MRYPPKVKRKRRSGSSENLCSNGTIVPSQRVNGCPSSSVFPTDLVNCTNFTIALQFHCDFLIAIIAMRARERARERERGEKVAYCCSSSCCAWMSHVMCTSFKCAVCAVESRRLQNVSALSRLQAQQLKSPLSLHRSFEGAPNAGTHVKAVLPSLELPQHLLLCQACINHCCTLSCHRGQLRTVQPHAQPLRAPLLDDCEKIRSPFSTIVCGVFK
jgi:hypothetical protein